MPYTQRKTTLPPRWIGSDCVQKKTHTGSSSTCSEANPNGFDRLARRHELLAPLEFVDSGDYHHFIMGGFRFNGMSAPPFAPLFVNDPRAEAAVALHDKNYRNPPIGMTRRDADRVMREGMVASGVDTFKIWVWIHPWVRLFGWRAWRRHRKRDAESPAKELSQNLVVT